MKETGASIRAKEEPAWDPDWIIRKFTAILACENAECGEVATMTGTVSPVEVYGDDDRDWIDKFHVHLISPSPLPITIGDEVPDDVSILLRSAALMYWMDPEAAVNKLRQATEALLTHEGVKKTVINRHHKRVPITLHSRIDMYKASQPERAKLLLAVKWIGNAGSHVGSLTKQDVLDGFDMLNIVIDELFLKRRAKVVALANRVNKRGRPLANRRR